MKNSSIGAVAITVADAVSMLLSFAWLMTHDGCTHPLGNMLALVAFVAAGTSLLLPYAADWAERNLRGN